MDIEKQEFVEAYKKLTRGTLTRVSEEMNLDKVHVRRLLRAGNARAWVHARRIERQIATKKARDARVAQKAMEAVVNAAG